MSNPKCYEDVLGVAEHIASIDVEGIAVRTVRLKRPRDGKPFLTFIYKDGIRPATRGSATQSEAATAHADGCMFAVRCHMAEDIGSDAAEALDLSSVARRAVEAVEGPQASHPS